MYRSEDDDVPDIRKKRRPVPGLLKRATATLLLLLATNLLGILGDIVAPAVDRTVEIHGHDDFTLPDGSTGVAYAGGIIRYTPDFNSLNREVTCTGDGALFHIANSDKMFVAYCDGGIILRARSGTFEVKHVPGNDHTLRVLVGTESLEITDLSGRSYGYFHAAEEAIINLETYAVSRKHYDDVFITDVGIRPILRFERMTLADAAARLAHLFNVDIRVSSGIRKELIDATFPADISIFEALEAIKLANRDKYFTYKVSRNSKGEVQYVTISNR